jgi:hypothetical protein
MPWQEIVEFLGGATLFAGVMAYLGQKAVDAYVGGRLEEYKGQLQQATTEHSIRYQRLHAERAEVIKELYRHISELDDLLASTLARFQSVTDKPLPEKVTDLGQHYNALRAYFNPRQIYLHADHCALVEKILDAARGIYYDVTTFEVDTTHPLYQYDRARLGERAQFWEKARSTHGAEFKQLKSALEKEFRALLGIGA